MYEYFSRVNMEKWTPMSQGFHFKIFNTEIAFQSPPADIRMFSVSLPLDIGKVKF